MSCHDNLHVLIHMRDATVPQYHSLKTPIAYICIHVARIHTIIRLFVKLIFIIVGFVKVKRLHMDGTTWHLQAPAVIIYNCMRSTYVYMYSYTP